MNPLPVHRFDPSLKHVIDDMNGRPIRIHCLLANHPDLLNAWWNYRMHSVRGGDLEQRDCELVILRVAVHMQAWYEWAAHVVRGLAAGLSLKEVERVAAGPSAGSWSKQDAALLKSVDQLIANRAIDSETLAVLGEYFSDKQIMDIVSLQGMYLTIACIIGTWDIEIEDHVADQLPESVTEQSFSELILAANRN
jgi:4-carboxymuconolactone decarboxylase